MLFTKSRLNFADSGSRPPYARETQWRLPTSGKHTQTCEEENQNPEKAVRVRSATPGDFRATLRSRFKPHPKKKSRYFPPQKKELNTKPSLHRKLPPAPPLGPAARLVSSQVRLTAFCQFWGWCPQVLGLVARRVQGWTPIHVRGHVHVHTLLHLTREKHHN